ncbi:unnamed protein product [Polarella glacialis]|uniref:Uncharacterized protein n=1 Tax=Polarella glacialis TaxID=89957 RepID=A0A813JJ74_POLGL|nr:unnamed protein product [Polarella glacialis]
MVCRPAMRLGRSGDLPLELQPPNRTIVGPCKEPFFSLKSLREGLLNLGDRCNDTQVILQAEVVLHLPTIALVRLASSSRKDQLICSGEVAAGQAVESALQVAPSDSPVRGGGRKLLEAEARSPSAGKRNPKGSLPTRQRGRAGWRAATQP